MTDGKDKHFHFAKEKLTGLFNCLFSLPLH